MQEKPNYLLADDIELIKEQLSGFNNYDFVHDLKMRMRGLALSQSELARRAKVSHAMVGRWLNGARPHGKERFKELGMALAMNEAQLNTFLCANGYPRLYAKNPLDLVCRFIIGMSTEGEETVSRYRNMLEQYGLTDYVLSGEPIAIPTADMSMDFSGIKSLASFEACQLRRMQWRRLYRTRTGYAYLPLLQGSGKDGRSYVCPAVVWGGYRRVNMAALPTGRSLAPVAGGQIHLRKYLCCENGVVRFNSALK